MITIGKGLLAVGLIVILLGAISPIAILSFAPETIEMHSVTTDDVTVTTTPQNGLVVTFSKGQQTSTLKLWTVQELNPESEILTELYISDRYIESHEVTTSITPQKIVLVYYYASVVSASNKPTTLKITIEALTNGISITGELIDFAMNGRSNTFFVNYQRDGMSYTVTFEPYTFTLLFDFATTQKSWFSAITDPFEELFAPKTEEP